MAHIKEGLEYFSLDTNMESDDKIRLIEKHHGIAGFAILIKLYLKIYSNGYYCKWSELENMLIADSNNLEEETTSKIINDFIKYDIFSKSIYDNYFVLTSKGIQVRYLEARSRNVDVEIIREYLLLSDNVLSKRKNPIKLIPLSATICDNLLQSVTGGDNLLPLAQKKIECQQKGKESKRNEKESIEDETIKEYKYPNDRIMVNTSFPLLSFFYDLILSYCNYPLVDGIAGHIVNSGYNQLKMVYELCDKDESVFIMEMNKKINGTWAVGKLKNSSCPMQVINSVCGYVITDLQNQKEKQETKPAYNYNDNPPMPTYKVYGDDDDE